jgi:hypothetical protein
MAKISELLNATGMGLALFTGQQTRVGVGLSGTWTGTVAFNASTDGIIFNPVFMTPFASGTNVSSATANGNWFSDVKNYLAFQAVFTRTTGSVIVALSASQDSSYQDAFLTAPSIFQNSVATAATNTLTIAAQANRAWRLRTLYISVSATATWAGNPVVQIKDGTTLLWAFDIGTTAGTYSPGLPADNLLTGRPGGLYGTPGNAMSIAIASGGGSVQTNINCEVLPAA